MNSETPRTDELHKQYNSGQINEGEIFDSHAKIESELTAAKVRCADANQSAKINATMNETRKQQIERLAIQAHKASEIYKALSMRGAATDADEREKQAVDYALATAEMFETRKALDAALSQPPSVEPETKQPEQPEQKHPTFDEHGIPTDETLNAIEEWPHTDPTGLIQYVREA